ncbi:glycoside hydrolase family 125 protein [Lepidopterella palustris CBS 459.81]|uniref:Glycoside hydrolase family 125 protein n=1 Tax=Lepidopterella palustris CBS 459.81 TaxID=1314670 RepID=A0A8E2E5Y3_9PEZI|nr:glycoside hydrolase family 125 protein [Lepidopterella palustris CBS 459.81]
MNISILLSLALVSPLFVLAACPDYAQFAKELHEPFSSGSYNLSYMRPAPECRTFVSQSVEDTIARMQSVIRDPDLYRLFQNAYPNTLDTAIKWKGYANGTDEELTFVITGDINAMWLRDSANQMQSYLPLLNASSSPDSLASLYRGVINLQARYLLTSPFCNSFQPPVESGISPSTNGAASQDSVYPPYNSHSVFECKYELDSLAAFLEVSSDYYTATKDISFFAKYSWIDAIATVLDVAEAMKTPTYAANGSVLPSPYSFTRQTTRASETLENNGLGNPTQNGTGLIRSAFRPSDDSTIYQLFIPANMMFSSHLSATSKIMALLNTTHSSSLATRMETIANNLGTAIESHGVITHPKYGRIYAYEIDGYGGETVMDDANIPSLLSAPLLGYAPASSQIYQNTRALLLSADNPYFMRGPVLSAIGGPHIGPGYAWPMASIVRIMTSSDEKEIVEELGAILGSTDGFGLVHESVNSWDGSDWTRQWFSWANGLFGQMVLDLEGRMPQVLNISFQRGQRVGGY